MIRWQWATSGATGLDYAARSGCLYELFRRWDGRFFCLELHSRELAVPRYNTRDSLPLPWLLGHVERELAVTVRRRRLLVYSVRCKLVNWWTKWHYWCTYNSKRHAKDRQFVKDTLPCSVVGGVALRRITETSHVRARKAGPPGRVRRFWLAGETSSWKTWPLLNVWQVEDIVFTTASRGGVQYSTGMSGKPVTPSFESAVLAYYIIGRLARR